MIVSIDVSLFESPIVVPFAISRETKETARIVIVRLVDQHGTIGLGEAAPFVSLTGDTAEMALAEAHKLRDALVGKPVDVYVDEMRSIYADSRRRSATAVIAFEMAIADLIARRQGKPLWQTFGHGPQRTYTTDITLPILPPAGIERFWQHFRDHAFSIIKIKVSGNVTADLDMIETFFKIADFNGPGGPSVFSLDGNQGFDVDRSLALVEKLEMRGWHPIFFEQPLPADDWQGLTSLSRRSTLPICLDETIKSCADVDKAKELSAGHMINLKIMKAGLAETVRIIERSVTSGYKLMIGGMLESEIAMGMSLHLVTGCGLIEHLDLDTPFFFQHHPTPHSPWHEPTASIGVSELSGLGTDIAHS